MSNSIFNQNKDDDGFKDKVDTHSKAILTVTQRQKDLESAIETINQKIDLIDHNAVKGFRKAGEDVKSVRQEILEIKEELKTIKEFNSKVAKQIKLMSTSDEVKKLEKYIDLWDPMGFVTREELEEFKDSIKKSFEEVVKTLIED